jgi:DNA-binding response OmpR family regulator
MTMSEATRVLVVDDDQDVRKALSNSLRRIGCEVLQADNGVAGLEMVAQSQPQVILLDIRMPQMDGHTFLRRLATTDTDAAVIVMSGDGGMDDVIEVLRHGAVDYLQKPWAASDLIAAVGRAMETHDKRVGTPAESAPGSPRAGDQKFAAVLNQVRAGEVTLPAVSSILEELRALVARPGASMPAVAALIEREPTLAARVLKVSNSAYYAAVKGANRSVLTAVKTIGLRQVASLVETISLHGSFEVTDPTLRALHARIWRYSVARGIAMRTLVERVRLGAGQLDGELAYVAGLLGDVGALFLLWVISERAGKQDPRPSFNADSCLASVREHHQEFGAALLRRWNLGAVATLVAGTHHLEAPPPPPPTNVYWNLAVVAAPLADAMTLGDDVTRSTPLPQALIDSCANELRTTPTIIMRLQDSIHEEFQAIIRAIG